MTAAIKDDSTTEQAQIGQSPVQRHDLPPGFIIHAKYRVVKRIGVGGMGAVYEVVNEKTGKRAALKLILPQKDSSVSAERFAREAKAANEIDHPGVVDTLDADEDPRCGKYIVMELLEGETLADVLDSEDRWPSVRRVVDLTLELLDPLAAAHRANRIHRDLKPENIFLHRDRVRGPVTKLMDFGLVRDPTSDTNVTQQLLALGTLAYMSPEQILRPATVQPTADVWAVGVMLYELLTHERPFREKEKEAEDDPGLETLNELCDAMKRKEYRRLDEQLPGTPASLVELVHRCLEPRPEDRPLDAGELRARLLTIREVEGDQLSEATPVRAEPRRGAPGTSVERRGALDVAGGAVGSTVSAAGENTLAASQRAAQPEPTSEVAALPGDRRALIRKFAIGTALCAAVMATVVFVIASGDHSPPAVESGGEAQPQPSAEEGAASEPSSGGPEIGSPSERLLLDDPAPTEAEPPEPAPTAGSTEPAAKAGRDGRDELHRATASRERRRSRPRSPTPARRESEAARAAREYLELGSVRQAIRTLERDGLGPTDALFLIQLYDQAGDTARARAAKQQFIRDYASHPRASGFRQSLDTP